MNQYITVTLKFRVNSTISKARVLELLRHVSDDPACEEYHYHESLRNIAPQPEEYMELGEDR